MYIKSLQRHIHVCAQIELPQYGARDPRFWNVISIREPFRPRPNPDKFLQFHTMICYDLMGVDGLDDDELLHAPKVEQMAEIFRFVDELPGQPILVHCWAGRSRSAAVALVLIVRAIHGENLGEEETVSRSCEALLAIRPLAAPNPVILGQGLSLFLDPESAKRMTGLLLNHPAIFGNHHSGASPSA